MTKKVIVKDLHKSFGKLDVLKGIDLEIDEGEVVCLLGPSGSGKSTFLRCLNGLEKSTSGTILVDGYEISDKKTDILVSTTVVEVGVNNPNATCMVICNAERFGLSQLHQLRGRIGRGKYKSTCILISDAEGETAKSRLSACIFCTSRIFLLNDKTGSVVDEGALFHRTRPRRIAHSCRAHILPTAVLFWKSKNRPLRNYREISFTQRTE